MVNKPSGLTIKEQKIPHLSAFNLLHNNYNSDSDCLKVSTLRTNILARTRRQHLQLVSVVYRMRK